jgi:hypothetical protein
MVSTASGLTITLGSAYRREPVSMTAAQADANVGSELPDIQGVAFDTEVDIDADECSRIMRRIIGPDEGSGVWASFNSSI